MLVLWKWAHISSFKHTDSCLHVKLCHAGIIEMGTYLSRHKVSYKHFCKYNQLNMFILMRIKKFHTHLFIIRKLYTITVSVLLTEGKYYCYIAHKTHNEPPCAFWQYTKTCLGNFMFLQLYTCDYHYYGPPLEIFPIICIHCQ